MKTEISSEQLSRFVSHLIGVSMKMQARDYAMTGIKRRRESLSTYANDAFHFV